jgi:hypothetical protein
MLVNINTHFKNLLIRENKEEISYNFQCILSGKIIVVPVRGKDCRHLECYELDSLEEYLTK